LSLVLRKFAKKGRDHYLESMNVISFFLSLTSILTVLFLGFWLRASRKLSRQTKELQDLQLENHKLAQEAHSHKELLQMERARFEQIKNELKDSFSSLASHSIQSSTKHLLEVAEATFKKQSQVQAMDFDQKRQTIEQLMKPVSEALSQYQKQVGDMEKERQRAFTTLDVELRRVAEMGTQLSRETTALKDALKKPHIRGRWGEVQLKNCIELAGMSEFADVIFQDVVEKEGDRLIPDMVVRMPEGRQVIVDAKTPLEAFLNSLEAPTEEARAVEMARHGRHIKEHVKRLSLKSYGDAYDGSADFTVMFLPNESFLYAALEVEPDLVEYALQKKVLIATPPTLIGLLKVIRFGWSEKRLAENAEKISKEGIELHKRIAEFFEGYESVGKHLEKAMAEYEKGKTRLHSRVLVQAKRFESLGVQSVKELPEAGGFQEENLP
jgi:DNA recombination protein RmuC